MHGTDYVVQPLPVSNFSIAEGSKKNTFRLSWQAVDDPLEPRQRPGNTLCTPVWDMVDSTMVRWFAIRNILSKPNRDWYTASKSQPSTVEEKVSLPKFCRPIKPKRAKELFLIVNAFDRLSGPATIESNFIQGFDLKTDPEYLI